jgi:hypothetical protein
MVRMKFPSPWRPRGALAGLVVAAVLATPGFARSVDFPPAKSAAAVKELIGLLDARQLDTFAAQDSDPYKFVAAMYVPGVQMFGVAATYDRPGDIDYFLSHKDFKSAYESLRSSTYSKDRFIAEDAECNGFVPQPKKSQPNDDAVVGMTRRTFDGVFADPKHPDPKKPSFDDYLKAFTDADERYTHVLTVLIDELKKTRS